MTPGAMTAVELPVYDFWSPRVWNAAYLFGPMALWWVDIDCCWSCGGAMVVVEASLGNASNTVLLQWSQARWEVTLL